MFDLDHAILGWRREMRRAGIRSQRVLDELESHLLEEVEGLKNEGETPQTAFELAVKRIGLPENICGEFMKLEPADAWTKFLRICVYSFPACMLLINLWTLAEFDISSTQRVLGAGAVLAICLYLGWLPRMLQSLSASSQQKFMRVIKLASSVIWLLPVWCLLEAEHIIHVSLGIVPTTILWCLFGAIAMTAFAFVCQDRSRPPGRDGGTSSDEAGGRPVLPTSPRLLPGAASISIPQNSDPSMQKLYLAASEEADGLGHDFIGTEHVLLALLRLAEGPCANILDRMHLNYETVREEVRQLISSAAVPAASGQLLLTPRANKAIQLAVREAVLNRQRFGLEHLLLGLLLEGGGLAALVLRKLGIRPAATRQAILQQATFDSKNPGSR